MNQPTQSDAYIYKVGEALSELMADIDSGGEYPDAEFRASRKYGVKAKDLRQAYDDFTSVEHYPLAYL